MPLPKRLPLSLRPAALLAALSGAILCSPAFAADVTVASPVDGTHVSSPVWIRAHNIGCEGVPPTAFGYSIDNSRTFVRGETAYDVDFAKQVIGAGTHIVHFKSWTSRGACPVVSTQFTVDGPYSSLSAAASNASPTLASQDVGVFRAGGSEPMPSPPHTPPVRATGYAPSPTYGIPANAVSTGDLDGKYGWQQIHDGGTPGKSRGSSVYPATTPLYDEARELYMTYSDRAGERWSLNVVKDAAATHFVLDIYVLLPHPSEVLNLEMDINQVTANGETIILGTQCAGTIGKWESAYTAGKLDHWWASSIKCDPRTWAPNVWHHIQIGMHREPNGVVSHDWVNFDSAHYTWGKVQESAHFLGWAPATIDVQYQIEGSSGGSGSVTSYIHKLTIYRW